MPKVTKHFNELPSLIGQKIGESDWLTIDQERIDKFAEATGDFQWIHVDVDRARKDMPSGTTIAHGYLTLSVLPMLMQQILGIEGVRNGINYGSNKVRFTNQVPSGAKIRAHQTVKDVKSRGDGSTQLTYEVEIEIEGQDRPALVAETLGLVYPAEG